MNGEFNKGRRSALKSGVWATEEAPFVLQSQVAEVAVQLAVTDRSGKPVTGLSRDDLQMLDNGKPAAITQLRREDDLALPGRRPFPLAGNHGHGSQPARMGAAQLLCRLGVIGSGSHPSW